MTDFSRTLVISDGDLAGILACSAASDAALHAEADAGKRRAIRPVLWIPAFRGPTAEARRWSARRQGELFEMQIVEAPATDEALQAPGSRSKAGGGAGGEWPTHTRDVVLASIAAIELGCSTVLWPTHSVHSQSPDLDAVSRAVDRALLISRLISLDAELHGQPRFRIDAPYADLSDRQLADLVIDMDLPVQMCWWWHAERASQQEEFRAQHERWTTVLREVGWRAGPSVDAPQASPSR